MPRDSTSHLRSRRLLTGLWTLGVILYFVFQAVFVVPFATVAINWRPDGTAVVVAGMADNPVAPGDILWAIDGIRIRNSDLQFRFGALAPSHTYTFYRAGQFFTIELASGTPTVAELLNLLLPGLIALEAWLVGLVLWLLAPSTHRDARLVGAVMLALALALAGAPAAAAGVPGARLTYEVLTPIVSVGYLEMAFLPRTPEQKRPRLIDWLYGIATGIAALALVEIICLNPRTTWQFTSGIRLETVVLALLTLAVCGSPIVMAFRAKGQASAYTRRQIRILLAGTGIAVLPFILFTTMPRIIVGEAWLPVGLTLPLLGAIPATYAFVILRHRYLGLDVFFARSLLLLLVILLGSLFFTSGYHLAQALPALATLAPVFGMTILTVGFGVVGRATTRLQPAIELLVYGPDRHYDQTLVQLRDELLADPQISKLRQILLGRASELLEVREAALYLVDGTGRLAPTGAIGQAVLDGTVPVTPGDGRAVMIRDLEPNVAVFRDRPWARLAVMLQLRGQVMGVWLLGARHTGEHFDSRDLSFLRRLATWAGVAIENVRLFEALQTMAADRLRVRAAERTELANRLHDEPLQRAYAIARDLERLQSAQPADSPLAGELDRQRKAVRDLSRELRGITSGLRPPILSQGLIFALDDVMRRFGERFPGVHIERHIESEEPPALSDAALDAAYFVVTEALSNVGKHSHADQVTLQVESSPDQVNITVADNGNSVFLAGLSMVELLRGQHHGIVGMHQWAKAAQGSLRLLSAEPRGTRVELILPIAGAADNA